MFQNRHSMRPDAHASTTRSGAWWGSTAKLVRRTARGPRHARPEPRPAPRDLRAVRAAQGPPRRGGGVPADRRAGAAAPTSPRSSRRRSSTRSRADRRRAASGAATDQTHGQTWHVPASAPARRRAATAARPAGGAATSVPAPVEPDAAGGDDDADPGPCHGGAGSRSPRHATRAGAPIHRGWSPIAAHHRWLEPFVLMALAGGSTHGYAIIGELTEVGMTDGAARRRAGVPDAARPRAGGPDQLDVDHRRRARRGATTRSPSWARGRSTSGRPS